MSRFTQELSRYRDRRTFRSLPELTQEVGEPFFFVESEDVLSTRFITVGVLEVIQERIGVG